MQQISADFRREIVDWIIFESCGGLYGDARDVEPTDWNIFELEWWKGLRHTASLRRARLESLADGDLVDEGLRYHDLHQRLADLMPRKPGRPKKSGSLAPKDQESVAEALRLMRDGRSANAASEIVALRMPGSMTTSRSKARRLRKLLQNRTRASDLNSH
jgi:hypothetical protein